MYFGCCTIVEQHNPTLHTFLHLSSKHFIRKVYFRKTAVTIFLYRFHSRIESIDIRRYDYWWDFTIAEFKKQRDPALKVPFQMFGVRWFKSQKHFNSKVYFRRPAVIIFIYLFQSRLGVLKSRGKVRDVTLTLQNFKNSAILPCIYRFKYLGSGG